MIATTPSRLVNNTISGKEQKSFRIHKSDSRQQSRQHKADHFSQKEDEPESDSENQLSLGLTGKQIDVTA